MKNPTQIDFLLTFINSIELVVYLVIGIILLRALRAQMHSWRDLWERAKRVARLDFQGGPYDMLVALSILFVGWFLRAQTIWTWRVLGTPFNAPALLVGITCTVVAAFCLIRIMLPSNHYNARAARVLVGAGVFATLSTGYVMYVAGVF